MNQISRIYQKDTESTTDTEISVQFVSVYRARELALNLISQIHHLVKDVQRHRGISMGLLAGSRAFEAEFEQLQCQITRRLAVLEVFSEQEGSLLSDREKVNLRLAWDTIREDWQGDKLSDNFELHSHFVEQLMQTTLMVAKQVEIPTVYQFELSQEKINAMQKGAVPYQTKQIELLSFTCSLLPSMIECMAKIRGLSSFAAASGGVGYQNDRRLRYLLRCAQEQHGKLLQCSQRMNDILGGELNARAVIREMETKFLHLMELVTHDVLSGLTINASSSQLFSLATVLIDKYWGIVDDGLDILRRWHRCDLDLWVAR